MARQRVVVIGDIPYWEQQNGAHNRLKILLSGLAEQNLQLSYLYLTDSPEKTCSRHPHIDIIPIARRWSLRRVWSQPGHLISSAGQFGYQRWLRCCAPWPKVAALPQHSLTLPGLRRIKQRWAGRRASDWEHAGSSTQICRHIQGFQPQIIIIEYAQHAYMIPALRKSCPNCRIAVDTHDALALRMRSFHRHGIGHWLKIHAAEEAALLHRADAVLAISRMDANYFTRILPTGSTIIDCPPGHPVSPVDHLDNQTPHLLYLGSKNTVNRNGISWFIKEVWPRIRTANASIFLHIAGGVCDLLTDIDDERITIHGWINNLDDLAQQCPIAIVPVQAGGGSSIKTIVALARGQYVIAEDRIRGGLPNPSLAPIISASGVRQWIDVCTRAIQDHGHRQQQQQEIRLYARNNLSVDASLAILLDWIKQC